ncbi:MAG: hypothetical protein HY023_03170 [Chloroflexi bacterium]|nr:hypothetical protein [Chloroflexota bacterium]
MVRRPTERRNGQQNGESQQGNVAPPFRLPERMERQQGDAAEGGDEVAEGIGGSGQGAQPLDDGERRPNEIPSPENDSRQPPEGTRESPV